VTLRTVVDRALAACTDACKRCTNTATKGIGIKTMTPAPRKWQVEAVLETSDFVDTTRDRPARTPGSSFVALTQRMRDSGFGLGHSSVPPQDQICRTLYWIRYMFCCLIFEAHFVAD
jgi:hypothetical protein